MTLDAKRYPILVVDDEQDNLDAFRFNFKKGFDILSATSGAEALEILASTDVAVIVTDQRMPKMTGLELLKAAKDIRPDAVGLILTAFTDVDVLIEAITLGQVYRYITKPWDAKEMRGVGKELVRPVADGPPRRRFSFRPSSPPPKCITTSRRSTSSAAAMASRACSSPKSWSKASI